MPKKKEKRYNGPSVSSPFSVDSPEQIALKQYVSEQKKKLGIGKAPSSPFEDIKGEEMS